MHTTVINKQQRNILKGETQKQFETCGFGHADDNRATLGSQSKGVIFRFASVLALGYFKQHFICLPNASQPHGMHLYSNKREVRVTQAVTVSLFTTKHYECCKTLTGQNTMYRNDSA